MEKLTQHLDQEIQNAIDFDTYLEEKCTTSQKHQMPLSSLGPNLVDRKPLPSSSRMPAQSKLSPTGSTSTSKLHQPINFAAPSKTAFLGETSQTKRSLIEPSEADLMKNGSPDDPCGRCGCRRVDHKNGKTFSYTHASGGSSGKSRELPITARTSCNSCKYCICSCTAFVEPFDGQPFQRCVYEPC